MVALFISEAPLSRQTILRDPKSDHIRGTTEPKQVATSPEHAQNMPIGVLAHLEGINPHDRET
jgi:hypothetical protein